MCRFRRGFTLIELLVVIAIIGILVALIIPGVNVVREHGRQSVCLNNQRQIGMAMLSYASSKQHLPGVVEQLPGGGAMYNWVEALSPQFDRSDVWEAVCNGKLTNSSTSIPSIKVLICPDDPYLSNVTSTNYQGILSYAVNDKFFVSYVNCSSANAPVNRSCTTVSPAVLSNLKYRSIASDCDITAYPHGETAMPATTIMLGECTGDGVTVTAHSAGPWTKTGTTTAPAWSQLTFVGPTPLTAQAPVTPGILNCAHPGRVIAVFFDGSGQILANDTMYPQ